VSYAFHLSTTEILAACALDIFLGDPKWLPHPVVLIGRVARWLEKIMWRDSERGNIWRGAALVVFVISIAAASSAFIIILFTRIAWWLGAAIAILIAWTTIAARGLDDAAFAVEARLGAKNLGCARSAMTTLVGRDPEALDCEAMIRATIESLAENASDAIVAPLMYLFIAGPIGAIIYKAINTLDSMIGYRNDRYICFGRAAARLDDLANLLPARITATCIAIAAAILNGRGQNALDACFRDASKHASPNAGWPEAAMAGALGVQLGGAAIYDGEVEERAILGAGDRALRVADISMTRQIIRIAAIVALAVIALGRYVIVLI
jgi:adenosylcobinamide-phosphate synthase